MMIFQVCNFIGIHPSSKREKNSADGRLKGTKFQHFLCRFQGANQLYFLLYQKV